MKNRSKELFDKRYRYSIRRLSVGAASVVVGCLLFGGQQTQVFANTLPESEAEVSNQVGEEANQEAPTEEENLEEVSEPIVAPTTESVLPANSTEVVAEESAPAAPETENAVSEELVVDGEALNTVISYVENLPESDQKKVLMEDLVRIISIGEQAIATNNPTLLSNVNDMLRGMRDRILVINAVPASSNTEAGEAVPVLNEEGLNRVATVINSLPDSEQNAQNKRFVAQMQELAQNAKATNDSRAINYVNAWVEEALSVIEKAFAAAESGEGAVENTAPTETANPVENPVSTTASTPTSPVESTSTATSDAPESSRPSSATPATGNTEARPSALKEIVDHNNYKLNYDRPAANTYEGWEHYALPLGNGDIGTKVFGMIGEERIQFNEKTLWSGGPLPSSSDYNGGNIPGKHVFLPQIRKALEDGDLATAKSLAERHLKGPYNHQYGRYLAFGDIYLNFTNQDKTFESVSDYSRELDLKTAISATNYTQDGTRYRRESFVSYPDDVSVTHLTKDGNEALEFELDLQMTKDLVQDGLARVRQYKAEKSGFKTGQVSASAEGILLTGQVTDNQLNFAAFVGVNTDGQVSVRDNKLVVTGASYATLVMNAATDFAQNPKTNYRRQNVDLTAEVKAKVTAAKTKGYQALKDRHIADYQSIYNRVILNITEGETNGRTNQLLHSYNTASGQELEELFFQYGRYLMITSSRDGENALPANLQGVWNAVDNPPWNSDYHLNVNLQMNYWPVYVTNMAETALPLINYVDDMRYYGRVAAKEYANIVSEGDQENGWLAHTQATPFGWTTPGWNYYWGWSPASNAWIMQNVYDYYKFTQDKDYLRTKIYPMLKETAKFWNGFLHYDQASDRYVSSPSYSPEHGTITIGNTFDQSLVWQLFHDFIEAANELGQDADLVAEITTKYEKLNPLHINNAGRIKEWYEEDTPAFTGEKVEIGHRHVSELVGLFPGTLFGKDKPEYLEAAKATLNHRGDGGTGWSKANKINLWARLLDGNRAHRLLSEQLKGSTLANLWDTHSPFQIDGNFGATSGMAEMLLQSHTGYIAPLPALPDAWKTGQVRGLMARGNVQVDMDWEEKNLKVIRLEAKSGGKIVLDYPNIETARILINGQVANFSRVQDGRIEFMTVKGDIVELDSILTRITDLTAERTGASTAKLRFTASEGAAYYQIERSQTGVEGVRIFSSLTGEFTDNSLVPGGDYSYRVRPVLAGINTAFSDPVSVYALNDFLDDRDPSISYGSEFKDYADAGQWAGTEKYADFTGRRTVSEDAVTASLTFFGTGIEIYGNKSQQLSTAKVLIDGDEHSTIDFYRTGGTEKGVLIGRVTGLEAGKHTLQLIVNREEPSRANERNKISLDYFRILRDTSAEYEELDDRSDRIQYGSAFDNYGQSGLFANTEKFGVRNDQTTDEQATASLTFTGTGIQIYGIKSNQLSKALVTIDGVEVDPLIFNRSDNRTEKGVLIGQYLGLEDREHTIKIKIAPEAIGNSQKKISLDRIVILKAQAQVAQPATILDAAASANEIKLELPTGPWTAVEVRFAGVDSPVRISKSGETVAVQGADHRLATDGLYLTLAENRPIGLVTARTVDGEREVGTTYAVVHNQVETPATSPETGATTEAPGTGGTTETPGTGGTTEAPGSCESTDAPGAGGATEVPNPGEKPVALNTSALAALLAQTEALENLTEKQTQELEGLIEAADAALGGTDQAAVDEVASLIEDWLTSLNTSGTSATPDTGGTTETPGTGATTEAPGTGGTTETPGTGGTTEAPGSSESTDAPGAGGTAEVPNPGEKPVALNTSALAALLAQTEALENLTEKQTQELEGLIEAADAAL
ncbi:TPA: glycoside hydrolase N-terminal domain-containing protein, partial [Streptococcus suis]